MSQIIQCLDAHPIIIAFLSLVVSIISFLFIRRYNLNFAKNEFVKKQTEIVVDLVTNIHQNPIQFNFTKFSDAGASSTYYKATLFELPELITEKFEEEYYENPVCFSGSCNQVMEIKKFVDNPLLPKSIADELEQFYARYHQNTERKDLKGERLIVITTNFFEESIFQKKEDKKTALRHSNAFALANWYNLSACCVNLEKAIVKWLKKYKVEEINIRKDFK